MPSGIPRLVAVLVSGSLAVSGCTAAPPAAPPPSSTSAAAAAQTTGSLSQAQLEQLLAPVALYPDALLAQILMASTYPLEVVEGARWSKANPEVKDKALEDAMQKQSWDPSVKSLTAFPQVLQMMNEKLSWTQQLGDAFLADQERVMKSVQKLRKAANEQGNLKSSKEQNVIVEQQGTSETIIKIEPADPAVVYVPTYNPTVVYGAWPYAAYPPYAYYPPGYVAGAAFWSFTAGVIVGSALWGGCNWGGNNVYINHNNYNNFNRTNISGNTNWNHNTEHRRGVSYKDQRVAQQYNRGANTRDAQAREQFRGRAEAGRSELGQGDGAGNRPSTADRSGPGNRDTGASTRDTPRTGGGRDGGPSAGTSDVSRGGRDGGPSAGTSDMSRGGRDSAGSRDVSGSRQASGFGGADHGRQASDFSSRGASSRQSSSFGGGGGGFGGGGRAGGGGRGGRR